MSDCASITDPPQTHLCRSPTSPKTSQDCQACSPTLSLSFKLDNVAPSSVFHTQNFERIFVQRWYRVTSIHSISRGHAVVMQAHHSDDGQLLRSKRA